MKEIQKILPANIWQNIENYSNSIEEIRIRQNSPVYARIYGKTQKISDFRPSSHDIKYILNKSMDFSLHSYMNELKNGFITINNGHRIGVCGHAIFDGEQVLNFKEITSINIRVARKIDNFSCDFFDEIVGKNILIISPPNFGKTTLLREICKFLSSKNYNLSVIDERFEISLRTFLGDNVDVISGVLKKHGTWLMLKSMSPDYIILDEITTDTKILEEISNCGVNFIATLHGRDLFDISRNKKHILEHFDGVIEIYLDENMRKYKFKGRDFYA